MDHPDKRLNRILFLENSGYPLDRLKSEATNNPRGKEVEFVSMKCNDYPSNLSYGYSELRMVDLGTDQSKLAHTSKYFVKVTGRLTFPELPRLLNRLPDDYDFAVDSRNNVRFSRSPQVFVSTQLMIFSRDFYNRKIRALWQQMPARNFALIENLLWDELIPLRRKPGAILRWPVNVDPHGQAAHWQKDYRSPKQRLISRARAVARVLTPWWWI
jgi:hypothetical protein